MVEVYTVYLLISFTITICVARTLSTHGRPFLIQVFHGRHALADAVNRFLVVGFYLTNSAFICLTLYDRSSVITAQDGLELLGTKIGLCTTILGVMHYFNLTALCFMRDHQQKRRARRGA